jgi:hypothetical protein
LTSSYNRYPFSLPMLISCRTSSYLSSIDKGLLLHYTLRVMPAERRPRGGLTSHRLRAPRSGA